MVVPCFVLIILSGFIILNETIASSLSSGGYQPDKQNASLHGAGFGLRYQWIYEIWCNMDFGKFPMDEQICDYSFRPTNPDVVKLVKLNMIEEMRNPPDKDHGSDPSKKKLNALKKQICRDKLRKCHTQHFTEVMDKMFV